MTDYTNKLFSLPPAVSRNTLNQTMQSLGQYGLRNSMGPHDSPMKGNGWLGPLLRKDGGMSTEISAGFNINGQEMDIPLMVPTLNTQEIQWLLNTSPDAPDYFQRMPSTIPDKAIAHALERLRTNQSPFK